MKIPKVFFSILAFLIVWELVVFFFDSFFLPSPIKVFQSLFFLFTDGIIYIHIFSSLKRTILGFIFALIVASILAYIAGSFSFFRNYLTPLLEFFRPVPPIAWIPLAIIWFGIGDVSASFIIFVAAFFPIFTNVYFGVTSIPRIFDRVSENYRLTEYQKFIHITFPFTLPYLIAGCKTSTGFSWMAVIAAEMVAGNYGLGYFLEINRMLLNIDKVVATMIIIGVIGYLMNRFMVFLELKLVSWRQKQ